MQFWCILPQKSPEYMQLLLIYSIKLCIYGNTHSKYKKVLTGPYNLYYYMTGRHDYQSNILQLHVLKIRTVGSCNSVTHMDWFSSNNTYTQAVLYQLLGKTEYRHGHSDTPKCHSWLGQLHHPGFQLFTNLTCDNDSFLQTCKVNDKRKMVLMI